MSFFIPPISLENRECNSPNCQSPILVKSREEHEQTLILPEYSVCEEILKEFGVTWNENNNIATLPNKWTYQIYSYLSQRFILTLYNESGQSKIHITFSKEENADSEDPIKIINFNLILPKTLGKTTADLSKKTFKNYAQQVIKTSRKIALLPDDCKTNHEPLYKVSTSNENCLGNKYKRYMEERERKEREINLSIKVSAGS